MSSQKNPHLTGSLGLVYVGTALPIILVTGMNGLLAAALTFILAGSIGENSIWLAAPAAEVLLVGLAGIVLAQVARAQFLRWGLFTTFVEVRA